LTTAPGRSAHIKELPYANAGKYDFRPVKPADWFWLLDHAIDHAQKGRSERSSPCLEDKIIGLSWAIIDHDDANSPGNNGLESPAITGCTATPITCARFA
jgi:hypothetical protein